MSTLARGGWAELGRAAGVRVHPAGLADGLCVKCSQRLTPCKHLSLGMYAGFALTNVSTSRFNNTGTCTLKQGSGIQTRGFLRLVLAQTTSTTRETTTYQLSCARRHKRGQQHPNDEEKIRDSVSRTSLCAQRSSASNVLYPRRRERQRVCAAHTQCTHGCCVTFFVRKRRPRNAMASVAMVVVCWLEDGMLLVFVDRVGVSVLQA